MTSWVEITTRYAKAFKTADKRTNGRIVDEGQRPRGLPDVRKGVRIKAG